jgi:hypothetical protein
VQWTTLKHDPRICPKPTTVTVEAISVVLAVITLHASLASTKASVLAVDQSWNEAGAARSGHDVKSSPTRRCCLIVRSCDGHYKGHDQRLNCEAHADRS